jgi:hypothetical protein
MAAAAALQVPDVLRESFLDALDNSQIRSMQNKQLYAQPLHQPGEPGGDCSGELQSQCCPAGLPLIR